MLHIGAQDVEMFHRGLGGHLGFYFGVLGYFLVFLGDGAFLQQYFGAVQLRLGQFLVRYRLPVIRESLRDVLALDLQQQLPFRDGVAQPGVDLDDAAGSQRNHRDVARNIGVHRARGSELRRGIVLARRYHRELLGIIHFKQTAVCFVFYLSRRRRLRLGIRLHLRSAAC